MFGVVNNLYEAVFVAQLMRLSESDVHYMLAVTSFKHGAHHFTILPWPGLRLLKHNIIYLLYYSHICYVLCEISILPL